MDRTELDKVLQDIQELKRSVRKANPFLRDIMGLRAYAALSLPLGVILLADSLGTHFLIRAYGSFSSVPAILKALCLGVFGLIVVLGWAVKWVVLDRRARELREGANFLTVIKAMYGGQWFNLSGPLLLGMIVGSIFASVAGHPWLTIAIVAILFGPFCATVAVVLDRFEYLYTGWYLTVTGLVALFFVEAAPLVWLAIVWSGTFLVFGGCGLAATSRAAVRKLP